MAWFVRVDRYGSVHMVRSQDTVTKGGSDSSNSCGIASVMMVNFKVKMHLVLNGTPSGSGVKASKLKGSYTGGQLAKDAIRAAQSTEPEIYKIYSSVTGSVYDGSSYTFADKLAVVLNKLNIGTWEALALQRDMFANIQAATEDGYPIIALCHWDNGGGHFCCIDETHTFLGNTISVCDPWDGEQRIVDASAGVGQSAIRYDPSGFVWSTGAAFGGNRHNYDKSAKGYFDGWIVRRRRHGHRHRH
jgi:hypothetical protein